MQIYDLCVLFWKVLSTRIQIFWGGKNQSCPHHFMFQIGFSKLKRVLSHPTLHFFAPSFQYFYFSASWNRLVTAYITWLLNFFLCFSPSFFKALTAFFCHWTWFESLYFFQFGTYKSLFSRNSFTTWARWVFFII